MMRTNKHMTADVHSNSTMVPSLLDPPKRNEVILTREEAQKKKPPKGYAYVPVRPAGASSNLSSDAVGDSEARRTRQIKRIDSTSSVRFDVKSVSADQKAHAPEGGDKGKDGLIAGSREAVEDSRGAKRKSMSLNVDPPKGDEQDDGADPGPAGSGDGGISVEERKRKKDEKRKKREKLREELARIMAVNAKIEEREQELRTRATASASESAGESRKQMHIAENGGTGTREGKNNGKWVPNITVDIPPREEGGYGETAQSEAASGMPEMSRQMSLQFSDATPGTAGKEKRTPKANSAYINPDFVSGRDKLPPAEKQKPKMAGLKRGGKVAESRSAKRQKSEAAHAKRLAEIMKSCGALMKRLLAHKWAWVFDKPVDVVKLKLPDYFQVIKQPMDLGTVDNKLKQGLYEHPSDFSYDVRLVFSNATTYNPRTNDVHVMADEMRKIFESSYKKIAEKIKEDEVKSVEEEEDVTADKEVQELHRRLKKLESQVEMKEKKPLPPPVRPGMRTPALPKPKKEDTEKRPMTFEEKRKLSVNLGKLPGDKLGRIVQIISSNQPNLSHEDDEIELDIDSMDNDTLWELERYVANVMKSKNKGKRKAGEAGEDDQQWTQSTPASQPLPAKKRGEGEDEVDIGDDQPTGPIAPVEVEKDTKEAQSSSGSSSSDDSGSSSSDSESGSGSSGSESEADEVQSKEGGPGASREKEAAGSGAAIEPKGSPAAKTDGAKRAMRFGEDEGRSEDDAQMTSSPVLPPETGANVDAVAKTVVGIKSADSLPNPDASGKPNTAEPAEPACKPLAESSPVPALVLTGEAATRAALLRGRYADSILNAQKKASLAPSKSDRMDPKKIEEMERKQKEERARLAKEAQAAQEARRRQEELVKNEEKRKRDADREAARRALHQMERTVNLNENTEILKDLHGLSSIPDFHVAASPSHPLSPSNISHNGGVAAFPRGGKLLEALGYYMKDDDDGEGSEDTDKPEEMNGVLSDDGLSPAEGEMQFPLSEGDGEAEEGEIGEGLQEGDQVQGGSEQELKDMEEKAEQEYVGGVEGEGEGALQPGVGEKELQQDEAGGDSLEDKSGEELGQAVVVEKMEDQNDGNDNEGVRDATRVGPKLELDEGDEADGDKVDGDTGNGA